MQSPTNLMASRQLTGPSAFLPGATYADEGRRDAEAYPAVHSDLALIAAAVEAMSPFNYANAALTSGAPLLAVADNCCSCSPLRSGLLVARLGMKTV
jgi:hypothetical protein